MIESIKDFEKTSIAMGLHLTPEQLSQRYNEYISRLEAEKAANPVKWETAEAQAQQQRESDRIYRETYKPTWEK